ncbi:MAG: hypothetical protein R3B90_06685 [Planctomycetaceae bacterium]
MAKKRASSDGFNMAGAIREALEKLGDVSQAECLEAVQAANPGVDINKQSFGVAFSNQRRKLGMKPRRGGRKSVKRRKPGARPVGRPAGTTSRSTGSVTLNMEALQAARKFVAEVGGVDVAMEAVKQLLTLQIS